MYKNKLFLLLMSVVVAVTFCGCRNIDKTVQSSQTTEISTQAEATEYFSEIATTVSETEHVTQYATISFACTGDNLIHSSIYKQANIRAGGNGYDFNYAYEDVVDLIKPADISVINQETLICNDKYPPSTYPRFNSPVALGDYMQEMGFDVFTIANNHTLDMNEDGLVDCLDYWDSQKDAVVCGAYRNKLDKNTVRTKTVDGVTFSFLAYTEFLNGLSLPKNSEMIIGNLNDIDGMIADIKIAKQLSDVCVVSLHWGVENSDVISDVQREIAKQLADAGADVIIGNHPHVLRNIEIIEADDGHKTLCAYSLGNFISAQSVGQNLIGGVLQFNVKVNLDDMSNEITDIKLIPIVTHYDYGYANIKIYKLTDYTKELADSHGVKAYSKFSYDYIFDVLKANIDEKYLCLD